MLKDHAQVKIDNMVIPLIGIPSFGTLEVCDWCGLENGIQDTEIIEKEFLCLDCKKKLEKAKTC
jgi:hypothetical protein